jgi:hypothetical protein
MLDHVVHRVELLAAENSQLAADLAAAQRIDRSLESGMLQMQQRTELVKRLKKEKK